ncbi:MAG: putative DNA binding domain-containing protein [Deltaproteobacteria bacterium]|nr:putative DNA binding domain-containing protein [Deltaproteobacteria bacterium]
MNAKELNDLVRRGEDSRTQFKQDITNSESLGGDLVAFSNSKGGTILVGVNDQGSVKGLQTEDIRRINQLLSNTATNGVRPSINVETENVNVDNAIVMVVTVFEGVSKPYADNKGIIWVKSGADKRKVTAREEIQRMFQSLGLVYADEVPIADTSPADIDVEHFRAFFEKQYNEPLDTTPESLKRTLENIGLAKDGVLNLASVLLFGRNPQRYRPVFVVKAVSFVGNEPTGNKYRDSEDIEGCLKNLHTHTMSFLTRNLRHVQGNKGVNTQGDLEVQPQALEELVVNMLLHRDYFISTPWRVFIFDNRIELISPGCLPNNLSVEHIRYGVSNMRNPLIASFATKELPYRGIGTGIRRALAAAPELSLLSDHDRNVFIATIPRKEN